MTVYVKNQTTGFGFYHAGVSQRECNTLITWISQTRQADHDISITVKP